MTEIVEFRGGHLKRAVRFPASALKKIHDVENVAVFGKFSKSAPAVVSLLVGAVTANGFRRPLARTDVIENLTKSREEIRAALLTEQEAKKEAERAQKMEGKIDLNLDSGKNRSSKKQSPLVLHNLPTFVTVAAPRLNEEPPPLMRVLMPASDQAPLYVELTMYNVSYLHTVVMQQLQGGEIYNQHPRNQRGLRPVGVKGVSRIYSGKMAGKYRFQQRTSGTRTRKRIIAATDDHDAKRIAIDAFKSLFKGQQGGAASSSRPSASTAHTASGHVSEDESVDDGN